MPKISRNDMTIHHADIKKYFEVEIMYNQENLFYAKIDPSFDELFDHATHAKLNEFKATRFYKSSRYRLTNGPYSRIVKGDTESECLSNIRKFYEHFLTETIQKRDVIIVFYNPKDTTNYQQHKYNDAHPQIGMQFGLTYAVETTSGDKKVYNQYKTFDSFGEQIIQRTELSLWNKASVIIDDTPGNREFLEGLYKALFTLNEKLAQFTATPDDLLNLIANNQKLLPGMVTSDTGTKS